MDNKDTIRSLRNPTVKHYVELQQKSSVRRREGLFVVEGRRELSHAIEGGFQVDTLLWCPALADEADIYNMVSGQQEAPRVLQVSEDVYARMAYRGSTEGVAAIMRCRNLTLDSLGLDSAPAGRQPLLMVLESVEKPGNLGAILRSADAAGADAVIVCDPLTDLFNPNLIRASLGAAFTVPMVACDSAECIGCLKAHGIRILTAQLQDSVAYYDQDMCQATAIVMGTESTGLTQQWRAAADAHIRIPMLGRLDSLNVSVSAAILLFEAVRQREVRSLKV